MMDDDPGQGTILIADDEPANLDVLLNCLSAANYRVLVAEDGENALKRARRALPDVVLMDVLMPRMDGFEACRELKSDESTRHIPVIFMTSVDDLSSKVRAFELGAADYVIKPFRHKEVLLAVAVMDVLEDGLSAVYTFFDPDEAKRSLGVFAVLWEVQECLRLSRPYLYLGYWIEESPKMAYKAGYRPLEAYKNAEWAPLKTSLKD